MIDLTKPVQTRDGRKVRILCTDIPSKLYPICGHIHGIAAPSTWTVDGMLFHGSYNTPSDLINVPETRVVWVNMYSNLTGEARSSRVRADKYSDNGREACVRVEYEVGQFDEE